jgi:hypothetical protein
MKTCDDERSFIFHLWLLTFGAIQNQSIKVNHRIILINKPFCGLGNPKINLFTDWLLPMLLSISLLLSLHHHLPLQEKVHSSYRCWWWPPCFSLLHGVRDQTSTNISISENLSKRQKKFCEKPLFFPYVWFVIKVKQIDKK